VWLSLTTNSIIVVVFKSMVGMLLDLPHALSLFCLFNLSRDVGDAGKNVDDMRGKQAELRDKLSDAEDALKTKIRMRTPPLDERLEKSDRGMKRCTTR